jgi:hypothetical protein
MRSVTVSLDEGATALDALRATGAVTGVRSGYVYTIDGLAEKKTGPTSGWLYAVNGAVPGVGANTYTLYQGDTVQWYYTDDASGW